MPPAGAVAIGTAFARRQRVRAAVILSELRVGQCEYGLAAAGDRLRPCGSLW
jgi:hypothetical protein